MEPKESCQFLHFLGSHVAHLLPLVANAIAVLGQLHSLGHDALPLKCVKVRKFRGEEPQEWHGRE